MTTAVETSAPVTRTLADFIAAPFLADLYGAAADGALPDKMHGLLWAQRDKSKFTQTFTNTRDALDFAKGYGSWNLYYGVGFGDEERERWYRFKQEVVTGITCMWADVDVAHGTAHKVKKPLPPTFDDAHCLIYEVGLTPTYIINSGHGYQALWLLKTPWAWERRDGAARTGARRLSDAWQQMMEHIADGHGWHLDKTPDLSRVLRLPGSVNVKDYAHPLPVRIAEHHPEARYTLEQLETVAARFRRAERPASAPRSGQTVDYTPTGDEGAHWLAWALGKVEDGEGRNNTGRDLACQLRDARLTKDQCRPIILEYQRRVPQYPEKEPYTEEEALRTLDSMFTREPREVARRQMTDEEAAAILLGAFGDADEDEQTDEQKLESKPGEAATEVRPVVYSGGGDDEWPERPAPEAFYGLAGEAVRLIAPHTEADSAAVLVNVLTKFGNAAGTQPYTRQAGMARHVPRLYACIVGDSATGRKGESEAAARLFFPDQQTESGLSTGEGLIHKLRDATWNAEEVAVPGKPPIFGAHVEDAGAADKRLMVVEPEFALMLAKMARPENTLSAVLRDAWDADNVLQTMTKTGAETASNTWISILGHITPRELRAKLSGVEIANGFANRFGYVAVRRSKSLPTTPPYGDKITAFVGGSLAPALAAAREIEEMHRDAAAERLWDQGGMYAHLTFGSRKPPAGILATLLVRGAPIVVRLSMIYALMDTSPVIREEHLMAAFALWEYMERSVHHIFGNLAGDEIAKRILDELRERGEVKKTDLYRLCGGNVGADRLDQSLKLLQDRGKARGETRSTKGRPSEVWVAV